MKEIKCSVLSLGNDRFVNIVIKTDNQTGIFFFYVNKKIMATFNTLKEVTAMYDSWFIATEEIRRYALINALANLIDENERHGRD